MITGIQKKRWINISSRACIYSFKPSRSHLLTSTRLVLPSVDSNANHRSSYSHSFLLLFLLLVLHLICSLFNILFQSRIIRLHHSLDGGEFAGLGGFPLRIRETVDIRS